MDADYRGHAFCAEGFCGGDIGLHHKFFDEFMGVKAVANRNLCYFAFIVHMDAAFGQFNGKRLALLTGFAQGFIGVEDIFQNIDDRFCRFTGIACECFLRLRVSQPRFGAHNAAVEFV